MQWSLPCQSHCSSGSAGPWCRARGPYRHSAGRLRLCLLTSLCWLPLLPEWTSAPSCTGSQKEKEERFKIGSARTWNYLETLTNLLRLIKHGTEVSKATASREFPKDFAEELLWIHIAGLSAPVVLPTAGLTCVKARCAVRIILFPLSFITQDLQDKRANFIVAS